MQVPAWAFLIIPILLLHHTSVVVGPQTNMWKAKSIHSTTTLLVPMRCFFQYGNGWSARAGISYANDRSADNDTEDYKEFQPSIGVMKSYTINDSATAIFDATVGRHLAESFVIAGLTDYAKNSQ